MDLFPRKVEPTVLEYRRAGMRWHCERCGCIVASVRERCGLRWHHVKYGCSGASVQEGWHASAPRGVRCTDALMLPYGVGQGPVVIMGLVGGSVRVVAPGPSVQRVVHEVLVRSLLPRPLQIAGIVHLALYVVARPSSATKAGSLDSECRQMWG